MATYSGDNDLESAHEADTHPTIGTPYGDLPAYSAANYDDNTVLPTGPVGGRRARREGPGGAGSEERLTPSPLGRAIVPLALALVSAVALVAGWTHLQDDPGSTAATPGTSIVGEPTSPTTGGPVAPAGSTSAQPSSSPSAAVSPSASPSPSTTKATSSTPPKTPVARPIDRTVPVIVLNATGRPGLAAKVASPLRALGWRVLSVGNWTGAGVKTTKAYLIGHLDAQATMAKDIATVELVDGLLPGMRPKTMTIVIGPDYPR